MNALGIFIIPVSHFKNIGDPVMLTEEKKEYFTELPTQSLDELLPEGNSTVNDINGLSENRPDPSDRATMELERDFNLRMRDRETVLIRKIKRRPWSGLRTGPTVSVRNVRRKSTKGA